MKEKKVQTEGRLRPAIALLVALWRSLERRNPRSMNATARRAGLNKDMAIVATTGPRSVAVRDGEFAGRRVRSYLPRRGVSGRMLYFHGGGYVLGGLESSDSLCRYLAARLGLAVLSVDYRLAPEHPFPAALDDALAVWDGLIAQPWPAFVAWPRLGKRWPPAGALPVVLAGDSAGAHLAINLSMLLRAAKSPLPAAQVLLYPVTSFADFGSPSYQRYGRGYILETVDMEWFRSCYLPDRSSWSEPLASPLEAADHAGFPPSLVLTADRDVLRDQAEDWAGRLAAAGVPVVCRRLPGTVHGFATMTRLAGTRRRTLGLIAGFLADQLG